jgi:ankyrin repeat protein
MPPKAAKAVKRSQPAKKAETPKQASPVKEKRPPAGKGPVAKKGKAGKGHAHAAAHPPALGGDPLLDACWENDLAKAKALVAKGISDVNAVAPATHRHKEETPLTLAACHDDGLRLVKFLLSKGANVNQPGRGGRTPIFNGASAFNTRLTEALLAAGADPNHLDQHGCRPIDLARFPRTAAIIAEKGGVSGHQRAPR